MKVIRIEEENHGFIGVANNYRNAVKWLIGNKWLADYTEIYDDETDSWIQVKDRFGEDWADLMTEQWSIDDFNDYWDGSFYLTTDILIGTEEE